jgi:hypothetical protein
VTYTLEKLREDFGRFATWYNSSWRHTGNGMGGETPDEAFFANLVCRREMPREMRKHVFAIRERRVVQRNGVSLDGISYYNEKLIKLIGDRVEARRDINDIGKVAIFSLPDCVYQFDAESDMFKDAGCAEEQLRKARASRKKAKELVKTGVADAEASRKSKMTPAEMLAEQAKCLPAVWTRRQPPASPKRRLLLPTDPGVDLLYAEDCEILKRSNLSDQEWIGWRLTKQTFCGILPTKGRAMSKRKKTIAAVLLAVLIGAAGYAASADVTVYVTNTGEKYHREGCSSLRKSKRAVSLGQAVQAGYGPCKRCEPPTLD